MQTKSFTTSTGLRIAYRDQGNGPVIAFSHGLLFSKAMYEPQIAVLSKSFRCVSWDHPGQGESGDSPERSISMDSCTAAATELMDFLELGAVHFVGLSMGGFVGMRLAAREPDRIRSLLNLSTTALPEPTENIPKYQRLNLAARIFGVPWWLAKQVAPIMFGRSFLVSVDRAADRERWMDELKRNRRRVYRAVNGVTDRPGILDELAMVTAPTLQLHGDEDTAIVMARAQVTCDAIAGARLQVIEGAGHSMSVECPEAVTEAIRGFIAQVP